MKLMTIPELARQLGNSRQWIWALVKRKDIHAVRVGGVFIINADDLPELTKKQLDKNNNETKENENADFTKE